MRIRSSVKLPTQIAISLAILVMTGSVVSWSADRTAYAVTPPDSCFNFDANTGTVIKYYDNENNSSLQPACSRSVDVPAQIAGTEVQHIGYQAFRLEGINAVTLPATLQSIGEGAFSYNQIPSIVIPDSVTSIGNAAFQGNYLTSVTLPSNLDNISDRAFQSNRLSTVTLPGSVDRVGAYAFSYNRLTSLDLPDSITSLGEWAFADNQLTSLSLSPSMTTIPSYAFYRNSLTSLIIPSNIKSIGIAAFQDSKLQSLVIEDGVEQILQSAFDKHLLASLDLPDSVQTVGQNAFRGGLLESVRLPTNLSTIGTYAFSNNQISTLTLPANLVTIQHGAFEHNQLTDVYFPDSVKTISNNAFKNNQLVSIRLSPNLDSNGIGGSAFMSNKLSSVDIPESLTLIHGGAFRDNNLTSVTIPKNVTMIAGDAFAENNIETVHFAGDAVSQIAHRAFIGNKIKYVELPANLGSIYDNSFAMQSSYGKTGFQMITSGTATEAQQVYDSLWYVQTSLRNPTNSRGLTDGILIESEWSSTADFNKDGDSSDSLGGHLLNAAEVGIRYLSDSNDTLLPDKVWVGQGIESFMVRDNVGGDTSNYYRTGASYTFTAPAIMGYVASSPVSPYSHIADGPSSTVTFRYTPIQPIINSVDVVYGAQTTVSIEGSNLNAIESLILDGQSVPEKSDCSLETASCYRIETPELIYMALDYQLDEPMTLAVETAAGESANISLEPSPDEENGTDSPTEPNNESNYPLTGGGDGSVKPSDNTGIIDPDGTKSDNGNLASTGASLVFYAGASIVLICGSAALVVRAWSST